MYCAEIAFAGLLTFLLTSFRISRFLGEPERYVEMVSGFSAIAGIWIINQWMGYSGVVILLVYYSLVTIGQLIVSFRISTINLESQNTISQIKDLINMKFSRESINFTSNNCQLTKFMMTQPWNFAYAFSSDEKFGGTLCKEAFYLYPYHKKEPFEGALKEYKINVCLLDKSVFSEIFEHNNCQQKLEILYDDNNYRLYQIIW